MQKEKSKPNNTSVVAKNGAVRCAIYSRCATNVSTEDQNSVAEQIRACTDYTHNQGWEVVREFVQSDVGAFGVSLTGCKSLLQLVDVAAREPRPFDCVLVADISRLGRSMDRVFKFLDAFHIRGVFVQAAQGEFDSRKLDLGTRTRRSRNCIRQYLKPVGRQCPVCGR